MTKTVDLKTFLEENRLGEYLDHLQAEGYEIQDLLESGDESLLELVGGKKAHLERLKRGLANLSANDSPIGSSHKLLELAGELPMVLAVPALEFCDQNLTPVLRLWALCDFVELSARLAVIVGIAEHGGKPPEKLRAALSEKIERPTLGQWLHMARAVAENLPENPAFSGLGEFISHLDKELCPLDKSRDFKRSVLALRNRLAHGGGLNKTAARDILLAWEAYVARLAEIFAPWRDFQMVSSAADGTMRILQGAEPKNWAGELLQNSPGAIYGVIGDRELNLWPLLTDSRDDEDILSGIYSRRGEVRLEYTPFEGDLAVLESEVPESFLDLLRRDTVKASGTLQHQEFTAELQKEAARRIGREEEFSQLLHGIGALPTGGLLWVGGVAGMGKSCLMASATMELMQCPPAQTLILPYRFKAGGGRCSVGDFLGYATERVEAWIGIDQERSSKIKEDASLQTRFMELLRCVKDGWDILVVADGLDELPAQSDTWLDDVIISSAKFGSSRVRWALAGRPERGIPEKLSKAGAVEVFPAGLPPMKADDVRSFFFERISRSKMRSRLIARDEEKDGATVNPFLREVVRRSEGLPVYMNHVIGDLIANKITPDQEGQLPKGITAYHEELLRRCAVGDLQAVMTPLVAILALAHEPLGVPALASILRSAGRLDTDNTNLVEKALAGVTSMIRRAATPEGADGYTLYHASLRQHVCAAESFRETIPQMRRSFSSFCAEAMNAGRKNLLPYIRRHGVEHFLEMQDWDNATAALSDLEFIEARAIAQELPAMLGDYAEAVKLLPEGEKERQTEAARQAELDRYAKEMYEYAATWSRIRDGSGEAEPSLPRPVKSVRLWSEEEFAAERKRMTETPNRLDIVRAFRVFVATNSAPLQKYSAQEGFAANLARNDAPAGPVHEDGKRQLDPLKRIKLIKQFAHGEVYNPLPACTAILEGHSKCINSISICENSRFAISGSSDKTLRVWNLESGQCLNVLEGHSGGVISTSISPDGCLAVSGDDDFTLRLWCLKSGECLKVFAGHTGFINSIALSADVRFALSGSSDKTLRLWNLESGECLKVLDGHTDSIRTIAFSNDGRLAISASEDKTLRTWDLKSGLCVEILNHDCSHSLDFLQNLSNTVRAWNLCSTTKQNDNQGPTRHQYISADGRRAVSATGDYTPCVWDLESGECVKVLRGHTGWTFSIAISADGRRAVSGSWDKTLRIWNLETGDTPHAREVHTDRVKAVVLGTDSHRAVSGSLDKTLRVWDLKTLECLEVLNGHVDCITTINLSADNRYIVSTCQKNVLRIWDCDSGKCRKVIAVQRTFCMALSICGRFTIAGGFKNLRVWDLQTGKCLKILEGHTQPIRSIAVDSENRFAVSGSSDNTLRIWNLETGRCLKVLEGHAGKILSVKFSADGRQIVSTGEDNVLRVWDSKSGECIKLLEGFRGLVSLSEDSRLAFLGSEEDNTLCILNLQSGECLARFFIRGLASISLNSPDFKLVAGLSSGQVEFYNLGNLTLGPFITSAHR